MKRFLQNWIVPLCAMGAILSAALMWHVPFAYLPLMIALAATLASTAFVLSPANEKDDATS